MAKPKTYKYKVTLRKKGEENVVTVEAGNAYVDSRGNLIFTTGTSAYQPTAVAAFHDGSWLSLTREEVNGDPTQ
jgi:hypothetical protein